MIIARRIASDRRLNSGCCYLKTLPFSNEFKFEFYLNNLKSTCDFNFLMTIYGVNFQDWYLVY